MKKFVSALSRQMKREHEQRIFLILRDSDLIKCLPNRASNERMTLSQIENLLGKPKDRLADGLQLLKKHGLAEYDKKKRGWGRTQ